MLDESTRIAQAKEAFLRDFVSEDSFEGVWLREVYGRRCATKTGPGAHVEEAPLADVVNVDYEDDFPWGVPYCLRCFASIMAEFTVTAEGLIRSTPEEAWDRWSHLWRLFLSPESTNA